MTKGITLKIKLTRTGTSNEALETFRANRTKKAIAISAENRGREKKVTIAAPGISNSLPPKFAILEFNMELGRGRLQGNK